MEYYSLPALAVAVIGSIFLGKHVVRTTFKSKRKKGKGKRCPGCKAIINAKRKTCQHCGYEFKKK